MSEFNFNMDVNTSLRLLTGGKYCDRDIVITVQEAPETGVTVAKIGSTEYKSVEKALANAVSGDTVLMVADSDESGKTLVIPAGVTLNIQRYALTANDVVGMNESKMTGAADSERDGVLTGGKLFVQKGNLVLSETPYTESTTAFLPVWIPDENCYCFSKFMLYTEGGSWGVTYTDNEISFRFRHNATGEINKGVLANGGSDNEIEVAAYLEWNTATSVAYQYFKFNDAQIGGVASANNVDYVITVQRPAGETKVRATIITQSGALFASDFITVPAATPVD